MDVGLFYKELFEDTLGLDALGLEARFKELVTLVETNTLATFGLFIQALFLINLDIRDKRNIVPKVQYTPGVEYYISDPILDKYKLPILGISKLEYNNPGKYDPFDPNSSEMYSYNLVSRQNLTLESVLFGAEYTRNVTLTDSALPYKRYHELRGSNVLYLRHYVSDGNLQLYIKTYYPNLVSIPEEYRLTLLRLAEYDIKIKLWNELKYLESVVTPVGNIDLKISDWESAHNDREEYLQELRRRSFPDRVGTAYFTIA